MKIVILDGHRNKIAAVPSCTNVRCARKSYRRTLGPRLKRFSGRRQGGEVLEFGGRANKMTNRNSYGAGASIFVFVRTPRTLATSFSNTHRFPNDGGRFIIVLVHFGSVKKKNDPPDGRRNNASAGTINLLFTKSSTDVPPPVRVHRKYYEQDRRLIFIEPFSKKKKNL